MDGNPLNARAGLAELHAGGVQVRLRDDGTVALDASAPPTAAVLALARAHRAGIAALLQEVEGAPAPSSLHPIAIFPVVPAAWCEALSARRAPRVIPAELVPWYDGVAHMQWMRPPPGFSSSRWRRVCLDAAGLLEAHGAEMLALGWTANDAFGLHAMAPGAAVRCYGFALLLDGGRVTELTAEGARIVRPSGAVLHFRRGGGRPAVPAWMLNNSRSALSCG